MSKLKETDDFGNRMKAYEAVETKRQLDVHLPIYARIDGRSFSKFTKGMKSFDEYMSNAMIETTKFLVEQTNAITGYVQSDEISLVWLADKPESDIFFSGKIQKMCSVLASMTAAKFAKFWDNEIFPHFDCRVLQLPSKSEATNMFLWRNMDCIKNAVSMAAQDLYSTKQLHGKNRKQMIEMLLHDFGFDFYQDISDKFKYGVFVQKILENRKMTLEEIDRIPPEFRTWDGESPIVPRHTTKEFSIPDFNKVTNRVDVIFDKATPKYGEENVN